MNAVIKKIIIVAFLLPVMVVISYAADAPEVDKSMSSSQIEQYLLFGVNTSDAFFHSRFSGGWCGEGYTDCARKDHSGMSIALGYGIELPSNHPSVSHAFEITHSNDVISGSERASSVMSFDIENQTNLEYNFIAKLNDNIDVLPIFGISNFDVSHQQSSSPSTTSNFPTKNTTKFYIGGGVRTKLNDKMSLKFTYKIIEDYYSSVLFDPNGIFANRDPATENFEQLSASLIYKY
ncbi:MAG: hypothetical protein ACJ0AN_07045 [Alphaproteobacteria bacterium]